MQAGTGPDAGGGIAPPRRIPLTAPLRRLLGWSAPAYAAFFLLWGAIPAVLLPLHIAATGTVNKVGDLAVVATAGAVAALLVQPLAGMLSDRTRSRLGKRAPWLIGGSLAGAVALAGLAAADSRTEILLAWIGVQVAYNCAQGPLTTVLPDRVPVAARGTFAAVTGAAGMAGAVGGQAAAGVFAGHIAAGYLTLAGLVLAALTAFVVFNPDRSSAEAPAAPLRLADVLGSYWVDPVRHPDFCWAFAGRLLLYTGYFAVTGYTLYLLQDHLGLGARAVGLVAVLGALALLGMIPAILVAGPLSDRLGRRKIFVCAAALLTAAGMAFPLAAPSPAAMMIMAVVSGAGFGAFQAVDQALMSEVLPAARSYGKDLGVVNIAAALPQILAPAVGGAIVLAAGYSALFPIGIAFSVLGVLAVHFIRGVR